VTNKRALEIKVEITITSVVEKRAEAEAALPVLEPPLRAGLRAQEELV